MFDAIIVFGGGVNVDGSLNESSRVRVDKAVELWRHHEAPLIVLSGAWSFSLAEKPPRTEAAAMAEYAEQCGCPRRALLLEEESKDTIGNAYFVKMRVAQPRGWKRLCVVAASHHIPRVEHICQQIFGPDYALHFVGAELPMTSDELDEKMLRERASQALFDLRFSIQPGDDQAMHSLMYSIHPGYAKKSVYSVTDIRDWIAKKVDELRSSKRAAP